MGHGFLHDVAYASSSVLSEPHVGYRYLINSHSMHDVPKYLLYLFPLVGFHVLRYVRF